MALNKPTNTAAAAPAYEPMDSEVETHQDSPAAAPEAAAPSPAQTQVATQANTAVASPLNAGTVLKSLQNAIPISDLESLGFGVFPRMTVGTDGIAIDKTKVIGKRATIEVLSWNYVWLVTPGVAKPSEEENKKIRTSYDGLNIKGGEGGVAAYIKYLKETEGYENAGSKQYVEVFCNLISYFEEQKDGSLKPVIVPADEQAIYQLSLSPQSVGQWGRYMLESGLRKARGIQDDNRVAITTEVKVIGANRFGIATFAPAK